jgi:hypothetical protein
MRSPRIDPYARCAMHPRRLRAPRRSPRRTWCRVSLVQRECPSLGHAIAGVRLSTTLGDRAEARSVARVPVPRARPTPPGTAVSLCRETATGERAARAAHGRKPLASPQDALARRHDAHPDGAERTHRTARAPHPTTPSSPGSVPRHSGTVRELPRPGRAALARPRIGRWETGTGQRVRR